MKGRWKICLAAGLAGIIGIGSAAALPSAARVREIRPIVEGAAATRPAQAAGTDDMADEAVYRWFSEWLAGCSDAALADAARALHGEQSRRGLIYAVGTLRSGCTGEDVRALEQRLSELGYLSGAADDAYDLQTGAAVGLFQQADGLPETGEADPLTQERLAAGDAPARAEYLEMDFDALARRPDAYAGQRYAFTGHVLQVTESESEAGVQAGIRVATRDKYADIVYVIRLRKPGEERIIEGDWVLVCGESTGLHSYQNVVGARVTLPCLRAESLRRLTGVG